METRSPRQSRTDSVETRAVPAPHIQAGDNISSIFVADHHHSIAGTRAAAAATGQPRQPPGMTGRKERGSPPGRKQQTFYPQYVQTQRWLSKTLERHVSSYDSAAMYVIA